MAIEPDDLDEIIRSALEEEAALPPVTDADITAALADPVLGGIMDRVRPFRRGP